MSRAIALLLVVSALPAMAGVVQVYNNQSTFQADLSSFTTTNFADQTTGNYYSPSYPCAGFNEGSINFVGRYSANTCNYYIWSTTPAPDNANWGGKVMIVPYLDSNSYIEISGMSVATNAVGMNLMTYWKGSSVTVTLSTGDSYVIQTSSVTSSPTFFGVKSDTPISWVRIGSYNGSQPMTNNFIYGTAGTAAQEPPPTSETPEMMSMMMIGTGLVALSGLKKAQKLHLPI